MALLPFCRTIGTLPVFSRFGRVVVRSQQWSLLGPFQSMMAW